MAAQNKNVQKKHVVQPQKSSKKQEPVKVDFFEKFEIWTNRHSKFLTGLCLAIALIFSLLLFNVKLSDGSDDAAYIEGGYFYAKSFFNYYFTFQAPLYPMFLALPIAIFGVNLVLLKMFSILFFVLGIFLYYRAFRNRIKNIVLLPALFLTALNSLFLYYAGQTFTEAFTLFMSGWFLCTLFNLDDAVEAGTNIKENWSKFVFFGLSAYLMVLTRNVAIVIPVIALIYFLFQKKWLTGLFSLCSFGIFYGLYNGIIKPIFWGHLHLGGQLSAQGKIMLQKNPYNAGMGYENFNGMVIRFLENAKIYTTQLFNITGLKAEAAAPFDYTFVVILIVFALAALIFSIKRKDRRIWAVLLYVSAFLAATFLSLATYWAQDRMIMIYLPLIAICVFYAFYAFLRMKKLHGWQWIYPVLIILFLLVNVKKDVDKMNDSLPVLQQNLAGDKYYGLTPDWINYFEASEWAADSLPKDKIIACRKAPMSFIYTGGRSFYGISSVPSVTPDSALQTNKFKYHFVALQPQGLLIRIYDSIMPCMTALAMTDKQLYYVYDMPETTFNFFVADMKSVNKPYCKAPQELLDTLKTCETSLIFYPDQLLDKLHNDNVSYIINASLRTNPDQKTAQTITTITNYMAYIQTKYPAIFERVHQTGENNNEPAWIYKINYPKK